MTTNEHHGDHIDTRVIEQRLTSLEHEVTSRFESMEQLLTQRIRHGDHNTEVVTKMLMDTVQKIQQDQHTHEVWSAEQINKYETRFRKIEDQQLTWNSSVKTVGLLIGTASGLGGIGGTILGLTIGG